MGDKFDQLAPDHLLRRDELALGSIHRQVGTPRLVLQALPAVRGDGGLVAATGACPRKRALLALDRERGSPVGYRPVAVSPLLCSLPATAGSG